MQPPDGMQPVGPVIAELAAAMCRAQGPSQALVVAAAEVAQLVPSLALAVAAEDRQSVRYSTLRNQRQGAARLGAVAASSCAAGLAIDTKQLVNVRDLADGDLGLHDLQYLQQEHGARACFVVPLVVAQKALGALSLAASQPDAFSGHEGLLQVVAAMCAPYVLLLKSHEGLLALEGLVSQVLPMRVALQLQDQQRMSSSLELPPEAVQQQPLPLHGAAAQAAAAAAHAAPGASAGAAAGVELSAAGGSGGGGGGGGVAARAGSSLRELRATQRSRQQQPQRQQQGAAQQQQPAAALAHDQHQQQPSRQQQRQQRPQLWHWDWRSAGVLGMEFQQPRLEQAYQRWALQQWLRLLDSMFLLVLLSAFASHVAPALMALARFHQQQGALQLPGFSFCAFATLLLAVTVLLALWSLHRPPGRAHWGNRRTAALAAVRVLRTLLLCCELWQLPPSNGPLSQPALGGVRAGQGTHSFWVPSKANAASCGLLLMLGLLGQLPSPLHAVVQAACLAMVSVTSLATHVSSLRHGQGGVGVARTVLAGVAAAGLPAWLQAAWLVSLGLVVPVVLVATAEWGSRRHFLRKLR